jgi:hypothetical protein
MMFRHRRPQSLAVLALAVFALLAAGLMPEAAAVARKKSRAKKARKPPAAAAVAPLNVAPMKFKVSNPNITQHLEIIPQAPGSVAFTLMIDGGCRRAVSGLASVVGGEGLTGQDEFAVSYPVTEYRYQGKDGCFLSLRIDAKLGKRATVAQSDCEVACAPTEDLMFRTTKPAGHGH